MSRLCAKPERGKREASSAEWSNTSKRSLKLQATASRSPNILQLASRSRYCDGHTRQWPWGTSGGHCKGSKTAGKPSSMRPAHGLHRPRCHHHVPRSARVRGCLQEFRLFPDPRRPRVEVHGSGPGAEVCLAESGYWKKGRSQLASEPRNSELGNPAPPGPAITPLFPNASQQRCNVGFLVLDEVPSVIDSLKLEAP